MASNEVDQGGLTYIVKDIKIGATAPGQEGSATSLSSTELAALDGVTAGTATASKAVVLGASKEIATLGTVGSAAHTITSADAAALAVGRLGATTPALQVDASTATSITGVKITSAASGGGVAIAAVGETNVNTTINAAGNGTISLNGTATGNIVFGRAATGVSLSVTGGLTAMSATAVPATAGAVAAGAPITCFSSGWKLWVTSDAPTHSATKGDLCINTAGNSSSTRLYVNDGTTTWVAITTAS